MIEQLFKAIISEDLHLIEYLLININPEELRTKDYSDQTVLHKFMNHIPHSKKAIELCKLLIEKLDDKTVNEIDGSHRQTALYLGMQNSFINDKTIEIAELLLKRMELNAISKQCTLEGYTVIHIAAYKGYNKIFDEICHKLCDKVIKENSDIATKSIFLPLSHGLEILGSSKKEEDHEEETLDSKYFENVISYIHGNINFW